MRLDREVVGEPERRAKLLRGAPFLGYGLLFLAGCVAAIVGDKGYFDLVRLRAERQRAEVDVAAYRAAVEAERQLVRRLEHDDFVRERIAREKLGLVQPGEVLILLTDDPRARAAPLPRPLRPISSPLP